MTALQALPGENCIATTCAYCGVGCGIQASVDEKTNTIKIRGDEQHPANEGRLCSKGTALGATLAPSSRLLEPRISGENVAWDTALDAVAEGFQKVIREHGPDAVAFYLSGQLLTEDYYVANKLMKGFIGTANVDTNSRLCMSSSVAGHKRAFGTDTVPGCYEDFDHANLIVLVGSNTAWCHPVMYQRIKQHKRDNPTLKVVVIDPRKTQTCEIADLHLPIKLGSDTWLFNGLLNALAERGCIDHDYVRNYCQGLEAALAEATVSSGDLARLSEQTGIPEPDLETFFDWFCCTEKTVTLYSQGVNQSASGTDKVNSILNCHLASGRIGRVGMGPFSMTGQPNAMGGREVGGLANTLAAHMDFNPKSVDRVNRFWNTDKVPASPGLTAVALFDAVKQGKIKAVWIMATNPVVSLPNANRVKEALAACDLVVVSDCVADTDTLRLADIQLPATGWSEKDGTVTNSERCISRQRALLPPSGKSRHDWWIISEVAKRMGFEDAFAYDNAADIFREHAALSGFENGTMSGQSLRDFDISGLQDISNEDYDMLAPVQWPVNAQNPTGQQRFFAQGGFFTDNRKARILPITPRAPRQEISREFPMHLNTGRIRDQWHTMTRTALAPQLNQHISEPFVQIHPEDAQAAGLKSGALVKVASQWGQMIARASVTEDVRKGDLFAPMHWNAVLASDSRINTAVNPELDPVSKQPESKHTPVKLSAFDTRMAGFILSRVKHEWPNTDYVVEIQNKSCIQIELADAQDYQSKELEALALGWLGYESAAQAEAEGLHLMSYSDAHNSVYRLAMLDRENTLQALIFLSAGCALPERNWLIKLFEKQNLPERTLGTLLSGCAPTGEDVGKIVCACFGVGEKTIESSIAGGCASARAVGDELKAGTNCGSCLPEIEALIVKSA